MRIFDVYEHPVHGYQAVKKGFSWPAFGFTFFWAFVKKMWALGLAFFVIFLIIEFVGSGIEGLGGELIVYIGLMVVFVIIGMEGNDFRRKHLSKRGFKKLSTVHAETPDAAIASVFKDND